MTTVKKKRWTLALMLATLAVAATGGPIVGGGGSMAQLMGTGPVTFGTMILCGGCIGAGISLVLSDSWVAFLAQSSGFGKLTICATACAAVIRSL